MISDFLGRFMGIVKDELGLCPWCGVGAGSVYWLNLSPSILDLPSRMKAPLLGARIWLLIHPTVLFGDTYEVA